MNPTILKVAVPVPLRRSFEYLWLSPDTSQLLAGVRVLVPFGNRQLVGILLEVSDHSEFDLQKLKPADAILDYQPILEETILKLCNWAASYYHHPIGEVTHSAMPVLLRKGEDDSQPIDYLIENPINLIPNLRRSPKQATLLALLKKHNDGKTRGELTELGISRTVIKGLIDKSLAKWLEKDKEITPFNQDNLLSENTLSLTDEQAEALASSKAPGVNLIFGITGSGKTEIYLQLIEHVLQQGKQALVLVPEIGLTPQTVLRFRHRFNTKIVVLHSGLTDRERLYAFRQARLGGAGIVIGTRSAIFTPLKYPGVIVVDEEHDASFKQQEGYRYHARDLAVYRGHQENIPVILGTATPSLESYQNALSGKYRLSKLTERPTKAGTAGFKLIGVKNQPLEEGFSKPLLGLIGEHLADGNQVLIFLNRRGFSPVLLCHNCGWMAECSKCDARLTYHLSKGTLICHHCGYFSRVQRNCGSCQSDQLIPLGAGTQRLEHALSQTYPNQEVIRIDRDSTRKKGAMEDIMNTVNEGNAAILVGTQMLAKGHHFPNVTLVAIMDMDAGFYSGDFRAMEKMGQLLLQVAGRAGRDSKPGTIALQTHFPEQPMLLTLINEGYETFANQLLREREEVVFPPFAFQSVIRAEANSSQQAIAFLTELRDSFEASASVQVMGPIPAPMAKRAGKHRAQLLLNCEHRSPLQENLTRCIAAAESLASGRKLRWSIDVDPIDLY